MHGVGKIKVMFRDSKTAINAYLISVEVKYIASLELALCFRELLIDDIVKTLAVIIDFNKSFNSGTQICQINFNVLMSAIVIRK